jgi:hypothetical protein
MSNGRAAADGGSVEGMQLRVVGGFDDDITIVSEEYADASRLFFLPIRVQVSQAASTPLQEFRGSSTLDKLQGAWRSATAATACRVLMDLNI